VQALKDAPDQLFCANVAEFTRHFDARARRSSVRADLA
jgi:hypothetical protein